MYKKISKLQAHEDIHEHMLIVTTKHNDMSNKISI